MIEAKGLSKRFGRVPALRRIDLLIRAGERVAIMGPNGSGKSTLLALAAGLYRPTSGTITLDSAPPRNKKASIGFLSHDSYLYPFLTVTENLRFYAALYGKGDGGVDGLIDALDLNGKRDALVHTLSRGQTQRAAIARTLVHGPEVLILDEPDSGLDDDARSRISGLLSQAGRTVLISTHDESQASGLADRVVRLEAGLVV